MAERRKPKEEISLGTFTYSRSTKRTHVYVHEADNGRTENQYVQKDQFQGDPPDTLEVILRYTEDS